MIADRIEVSDDAEFAGKWQGKARPDTSLPSLFVMISTFPIDTFSLVAVITLYLFLQLISRCKVSVQNGDSIS